MGLGSRSEDCCCCIGVKAGTLILLYLDLFVVIIALVATFNATSSGSQSPAEVTFSDDGYSQYSSTGNSHYSFGNSHYSSGNSHYSSGNSHYSFGNNGVVVPFIIGFLVLFIIIVAGLFAIGKKKPSLLIPYFIMRIVIAIAVIVCLAPFLFLEKKGLDVLDSPKSYNNVYSSITGDNDNNFGKILNGASNVLYALIIGEILLIILQIHFAKVVYACYKKIGEELVGNGGIIYPSAIAPCTLPYMPLHQQPIAVVLPGEPVYAC